MNKYGNISVSNSSLITAGLPSGSIMTARFIQPSSIIKQNHHLNQNRATDTQPITLPSENNDNSQNTILSYRTISDTYLNLSRKDIDDVMTALHTLAYYVQNGIKNKNHQDVISMDDNESHPLTMFYSKSTNHTLKSFSNHYYRPRYSLRHSLSSDRFLNHHIKHNLNLVEEFQYDLYNMKRKQERRILHQLEYYQNYFNHQNLSTYPSYTSNTILYTSTCRSNLPSRQIYHCSRQHQSTIKTPSEYQYQQSIKKPVSSSSSLIPLSSYILDKFIYLDQNQPISNIQMLPEQAHTLQILQNNPIHNFMSTDSLNTRNISHTTLKSCCVGKTNENQISGMGDQLNLNKTDVATQWSLQRLKGECNEMDIIKSDISLRCQNDRENSTILTELSQSIKTITSNNSTINKPFISKVQSIVNNSSLINDLYNIELNHETNEKISLENSTRNRNDQVNLTKSETEQFLTIFNIPTCKCSTKKHRVMHTNLKQPPIDDSITCISLDSDSSLDKKKTKQTSIKYSSKRPRHHRSKSSRNNQTIKRSRLHHHSPSTNQLMTIDPQEDSSFDFFDIDTTFSDTYDRLFTYITTSENSL